ncbi:MAG: mechanosensitive ion channel family protein [Bacteroidales bacterium]|nr:mechanosensitive ion channel family protein [Bacteroidales bacterium]
MFEKYGIQFEEWLTGLGAGQATASFIKELFVLIIVILLSMLVYVFVRRILLNTMTRVSRRTKTKWDDVLVKRRVFRRFAYLAPALIVYLAIPFIFKDMEVVQNVLNAAIRIYIVFIVLLALDAILSSLLDIYEGFTISQTKPIKGYIQIVKIFIFFIGGIIIIGELIGKTPVSLLTGLGALTAVLLFVFRDPILGFIGSVQLSANDLVRPGDWISMPKHNADGIVTDINLTAIKVQNWDKTIANIPTYSMVSDSFQNWRGMQESGGRRIKRSVRIDMNSIRFCTPEMIERFRRIHLLSDYIDQKQKELKEYNEKNEIDESVLVNGRRLTNLGVFRQYLKTYLERHPEVKQDMTFLVRHLQPTEVGLPVEVYVFSAEQEWAKYEEVQAHIFDHILAVVPQFDLKVFQNPTGSDFKQLIT